MEPINKELILKEVPLFAQLTVSQRRLIEERCVLTEYKKNQIVYEEGQPADAFYCVILGRVVIYTRNREGKETILEYLHRGKYFGIISLLTFDPHSVTARAVNDSLLLVIKKEDFDFILKNIPQLAIDLSQTLSRRLKNRDLHQKTVFESTAVSVFSSQAQAGKTIYALNLALSIKKETAKSVIILDILPEEKRHSLPVRLEIGQEYPAFDVCREYGRVGDLSAVPDNTARLKNDFILKSKFGVDLLCVFYRPEDECSFKGLVAILSFLVNDYHYVVLDLPSDMDRFVFQVLNQSDVIHILSSPKPIDLVRSHHLIERLKKAFHFPEAKIKVLINEYKFSNLTHEQQLGLLGHPIFATLPRIEFGRPEKLVLDQPDSEYAKAIRRISRQFGDCLVGLALGVGLAYGFCHIGILKVIEEEKIPIDVISGASIGALIASLWACGRSAREILEITREFREPNYIWGFMDFTFPHLGFIKGDRLYRFLKKHLGNKTFYDVKLPLKIVASDVKRKESRVLDKGPLVDAIMASCAMPGVFTPFRFKEEILFDGGVITPLPTEVLFNMGIRKIIAINVTPSREDMVKECEALKGQVNPPEAEAKKMHFSLKRYIGDKLRDNILGIIFSSVELMQSEIVQKEAQLADVVLHPDMRGLSWLQLHRAEDFAKRGEEEIRRNLDKIKQVVYE